MGPVHLRRPTAEEDETLTARLGDTHRGMGVFLLEPDSIESYIIAHGVRWADYEIMLGEESPLLSSSDDRPLPVDGVMRFAE